MARISERRNAIKKCLTDRVYTGTSIILTHFNCSKYPRANNAIGKTNKQVPVASEIRTQTHIRHTITCTRIYFQLNFFKASV